MLLNRASFPLFHPLDSALLKAFYKNQQRDRLVDGPCLFPRRIQPNPIDLVHGLPPYLRELTFCFSLFYTFYSCAARGTSQRTPIHPLLTLTRGVGNESVRDDRWSPSIIKGYTICVHRIKKCIQNYIYCVQSKSRKRFMKK
jgi:hypothetical protein